MPDIGAGAAEDVVPLGLLLPLRDAVRFEVTRCVAVGAVAVLVVAVLRGLLGGQNLLEILAGVRARIEKEEGSKIEIETREAGTDIIAMIGQNRNPWNL